MCLSELLPLDFQFLKANFWCPITNNTKLSWLLFTKFYPASLLSNAIFNTSSHISVFKIMEHILLH
jgi:hypothetical protein